jgi:hypothetical protein
MNEAIKAAYAADDGTEMIEVAPHQTINRCAHDDRKHSWEINPAKRHELVCRWCKQRV